MLLMCVYRSCSHRYTYCSQLLQTSSSSTLTDSEEDESLSANEIDYEGDNSSLSTVINSERLSMVSLKLHPKPHPPSLLLPVHLPVGHQDGM